jgi:hypothetical protein
VTTSWLGTSVVRQNAKTARWLSMYIVVSIDCRRVSEWQASDVPRWPPVHRWPRCRTLVRWLAYVGHAPLGLSFNGSLWFRWQLQNRGPLALTQCCQQHNPAIRKFQRIAMRHNLVFVDLPEDRRLMLDHFTAPRYQAGR